MTRARARLILSEGAMSAEWVKHIRAAIVLQRVQGFVDASDAAKIVNAGGIEIALRRPDPPAPGGGPPPPPGEATPLRESAKAPPPRARITVPALSESDCRS